MRRIQISRIQIFVILSAVLFSGFLLIVILFASTDRIKQPIAFNHKIHAENGLECLDCHPYFEEHRSSGKPVLETCASCHEEPMGESKSEKELIQYIESEEEIGWERLYRVPEDVYFSHRRHVVLGNIECKTCHGDIGESTKPPSKPLKITMNKCMNCHEKRDVNNDCASCHR